ncbi:hypothetical protein ACFVTC_31295 [Streptomyces sp. NPDC057950]
MTRSPTECRAAPNAPDVPNAPDAHDDAPDHGTPSLGDTTRSPVQPNDNR